MYRSIVTLSLCLFVWCTSQAQLVKFTMKPDWKVGDTHRLKIISVATDKDEKTTNTSRSVLNASFHVQEVNDMFITIVWTYDTPGSIARNGILEDEIIAGLSGTKLVVRHTWNGVFFELVNSKEVGERANQVADSLVRVNQKDSDLLFQYQAIKELVSSKQGMEIALLKHIKLYSLTYGRSFVSGKNPDAIATFPNPFGGYAFNAVEHFDVTNVDTVQKTCRIEAQKDVDGKGLQAAMTDFFKKAGYDKESMDLFQKDKLEMSESMFHEVNYQRGTIRKASVKRVFNLGVLNRVTQVELIEN